MSDVIIIAGLVVAYLVIAVTITYLAARHIESGEMLAPFALVWPFGVPFIGLYMLIEAIAEKGARIRRNTPRPWR
jgi:hypothetical protein